MSNSKPGYIREEIVDGDHRETLWVCNKQLEVGIVFDVSVSIGEQDFETVKTSLSSFLKRFKIGPKDMRVSLIPFENDIHPQKGFSLNDNKDDVLHRVKTLPHIGLDEYREDRDSRTNTSKAIEYMRTNQLSDKEARTGIPRVAIVFTDGNSQNKTGTEEQAEIARKDGLKVYAVGYGRDINLEELERIAGDNTRVKLERDFDKLESVLIGLSMEVCDGTPENKQNDRDPEGNTDKCEQLDIGIIFDVSVSIHEADFVTLKTSLISFLEKFDIGPKNMMFCLIPFENDIHPKQGFCLNDNKDDILRLVKTLPHIGLDESREGRDSRTNTSKAIEYMRTNLLSEKEARSGIPRVVIVFTDGNSQNWSGTDEQAKLARSDGIKMYAVGFGKYINQEELERIAGDKSRVKMERNFDKLENVLKDLAVDVCTIDPGRPIIV